MALGFPDILFEPDDAFRQLLAYQAAKETDVVLGLFPCDQPQKADMVILAEDVEGEARALSEVAEALRHVAEAEETDEGDRQVAEYRHHSGCLAGANLRSVFVEGDVADPVAAVLDRPVPPDELEEIGR